MLADAGQPLDAVKRGAHLAVFQGEVEEGLEPISLDDDGRDDAERYA